jgi:hypothetical protein
MNNTFNAKKQLQVFFLLLFCILSSQTLNVAAAGIKVNERDYGIWKSAEKVDGNLIANFTRKVTITDIDGHTLDLQVEENGSNINITQVNVAEWYQYDRTIYYTTTDWDDHQTYFKDHYNGFDNSKTSIKQKYFYVVNVLPVTIYEFKASFTISGDSVDVLFVYNKVSGTLLEERITIITSTETITQTIVLEETNIPLGFSLIFIGIVFGSLIVVVLVLSIIARRVRSKKAKKTKEYPTAHDAYYVPPEPTYSYEKAQQSSGRSYPIQDLSFDKSSSQDDHPEGSERGYGTTSRPSDSYSNYGSARTSTEPTRKERFCPLCGAKVAENESHCPKCGAPVD